MTAWLKRKGHNINHKRVRRLMKLMGIEAIYQKPRLSESSKEHKKYPYLLGGLNICVPNQVWCSDITYIPMHRGFMYLVVIMDWFSRYVLAWELSNTMDTTFCLDALSKAQRKGTPQIFNTDQGSQFTSIRFTEQLKQADIRISMDGKGRFFDNIFVERLWRSVKYEEVYLHDYQSASEAKQRLDWYFSFYNNERLHQSLEYKTPAEVHYV